MFARQFKKIISLNLLLGGGISLVLILALFFWEAQNTKDFSFLKPALFLWLGLFLFSYEMIFLEAKSTVNYFKSFPLIVFPLVLLWLPFKHLSFEMLVQAGVLFWVFDGLIRIQKDSSPALIFNRTLIALLLIFYNPTQAFFLIPLFIFFMVKNLFQTKALIAFALPAVFTPFFLYSTSLYREEIGLSLEWTWQYKPWHLKSIAYTDMVWFFLIFALFLLVVKGNSFVKERIVGQITLGLVLWTVSTVLLGFLFEHNTQGRWDWSFFPAALLFSHVVSNLQKERLINTLIGIIFVGGVLIRIFIL